MSDTRVHATHRLIEYESGVPRYTLFDNDFEVRTTHERDIHCWVTKLITPSGLDVAQSNSTNKNGARRDHRTMIADATRCLMHQCFEARAANEHEEIHTGPIGPTIALDHLRAIVGAREDTRAEVILCAKRWLEAQS